MSYDNQFYGVIVSPQEFILRQIDDNYGNRSYKSRKEYIEQFADTYDRDLEDSDYEDYLNTNMLEALKDAVVLEEWLYDHDAFLIDDENTMLIGIFLDSKYPNDEEEEKLDDILKAWNIDDLETKIYRFSNITSSSRIRDKLYFKSERKSRLI